MKLVAILLAFANLGAQPPAPRPRAAYFQELKGDWVRAAEPGKKLTLNSPLYDGDVLVGPAQSRTLARVSIVVLNGAYIECGAKRACPEKIEIPVVNTADAGPFTALMNAIRKRLARRELPPLDNASVRGNDSPLSGARTAKIDDGVLAVEASGQAAIGAMLAPGKREGVLFWQPVEAPAQCAAGEMRLAASVDAIAFGPGCTGVFKVVWKTPTAELHPALWLVVDNAQLAAANKLFAEAVGVSGKWTGATETSKARFRLAALCAIADSLAAGGTQ